MSDYKWFPEEMVWKKQRGRAKVWTATQPPLPKWAKDNNGRVEPARFVRMWSAAESLSDLKSELFWLSLEEIETMRCGISGWLVGRDIEPLTPFTSQSEPLREEDLRDLLNEGALKPVPGSALDAAMHPPEEDGELDLTPAPPRPNEDPLQGKTFNEIMHLPQVKDERQMVTMMGMGKGVRFTAKH